MDEHECNTDVSEKTTLDTEIPLHNKEDSLLEVLEGDDEEELMKLSVKLKTLPTSIDDDEVCWQTEKWKCQEKHIFIMSSAGKPIYSRHGNEDDLVTLFGVMQAIASVVSDSEDEIQSIHTSNSYFTFLRKGNLLLVSVTRLKFNPEIAAKQLKYTYDQIVSILTLTQLTRIFEQYNNFDLRRLLTGSERLISSYIDYTENEPGFFLNSYECVPLNVSIREGVTQAITSSCLKIKNLLFAILISDNQLISMIRMKKYNLVPADLHLVFNLIRSSQSFKTAEGWIPICLPNFDPSGYLQAYISYLSDNCQACLVLLTVDRELFSVLSEAKQKIVEKLMKGNLLDQLSEAMKSPRITTSDFCIPKLRHFIYKVKSFCQFAFPNYEIPYHKPESQKSLLQLYTNLSQHLNTKNRPLKVLFQQLKTEAVLAWDTKGFELYFVFEPFISKPDAIQAVNKLLKCMKKEDDKLFICTSPTF